jgi:hypothetical protein
MLASCHKNMSRTKFNNCPKCKIGKLKPLGKVVEGRDPNTNRVTGDERDYPCDNCSYPDGGVAKVIIVNEQVNVGEV